MAHGFMLRKLGSSVPLQTVGEEHANLDDVDLNELRWWLERNKQAFVFF